MFLLFQCNSYVCIQVKGFYFVVFIPRPTKCAWSSFYYLAPLCFASLMFYFPPHMATLAHLLMFPTRMLSVGYLCAAPWTGVLPISFMAGPTLSPPHSVTGLRQILKDTGLLCVSLYVPESVSTGLRDGGDDGHCYLTLQTAWVNLLSSHMGCREEGIWNGPVLLLKLRM